MAVESRRRIAEAYLTFLRAQPCVICGRPAEAHHLSGRGWREWKRDDLTATSLCHDCHMLIHQVGLERALQLRNMPLPRFVASVVRQLADYFSAPVIDNGVAL
jgi:hypothetical protein